MANGFIGSGVLRIGDYNATPANRRYARAGNATVITVNVTKEKQAIPNMQNCAGGDADVYQRISAVGFAATLMEWTPENLALALGGTFAPDATAQIADESISVKVGKFTPLAHVVDLATPPVVKDDTGTTTYTAGEDYIASAGGIEIPKTGSDIQDDDVLKVSYTSKTANKVQGFLKPDQEVSILLEGINKNEGCAPGVLRIHRAKVSLEGDLALVGNAYGELKITGEVLADPAVTAAGESQYFEWLKS